MPERVPHVRYQIDWTDPPAGASSKANSDVVRTRLRDVVDKLVMTALENKSGRASVSIMVERVSKKPTRVRIVK